MSKLNKLAVSVQYARQLPDMSKAFYIAPVTFGDDTLLDVPRDFLGDYCARPHSKAVGKNTVVFQAYKQAQVEFPGSKNSGRDLYMVFAIVYSGGTPDEAIADFYSYRCALLGKVNASYECEFFFDIKDSTDLRNIFGEVGVKSWWSRLFG